MGGRAHGPRASNLPADLTSFVGRRQELREVKRMLTTTRLLLPVTDSMLPTPDPDTPAGTVCLADAKASVRAVADIVNRQAGPVVEALRSAR